VVVVVQEELHMELVQTVVEMVAQLVLLVQQIGVAVVEQVLTTMVRQVEMA
jgi:hypothetical protein